ncbi:MAG: HAMP domain-containing protein [Nitrospinae bacterium]|nr:HAMP domain-containing protein [Nitrospinota bacterium]
MKIRAKIGGGFGIVVLLLIFQSVIGVWRLNVVNDGYRGEVMNDVKAEELAAEVKVAILEALVAEIEFSKSQDKALFAAAREKLAGVDKLIGEHLAQPEAGGASQLKDLRERLGAYQKALDELAGGQADATAQPAMMAKLKEESGKLHSMADDIIKLNKKAVSDKVRELSNMASVGVTLTWVACALSAVVAMVFGQLLARSVAIPMGKAVHMIRELGEGRLDNRLRMDSGDEIGQMGKAMDDFADNLQFEVVAAFDKLAEGDLTFDAKGVIRDGLQKTNESLNGLIAQINSSGEQIATGSALISESSQSLFHGAADQANSLGRITTAMEQMGAQTSHNAENAKMANTLAESTRTSAENGNNHMKQMVGAMAEINESSQNISKIIKVIDEIAFQTNLLALNAAVEAARAGKHGKGFAVVAEEVRNLAARSAQAAKETAELIEGSVGKTKNGAQIADRTAAALGEIVGSVSQVTKLVAEISAASTEQASGIAEVNKALSQIDQVTQQNTAIAEKSASAAERLASQVGGLKEMLSRFRLKDTRRITSGSRGA